MLDLEYPTIPTLSCSSNTTLVDTSEEDEAGTSQQNIYKFPFFHPTLSKQGDNITKDVLKYHLLCYIILYRKLKYISVQVMYCNFQGIERVILESPCGKDIFEEYNTKGFLNDRCRRRLINIVVTQMLTVKELLQRPLTAADKCHFAKIIVEIFPKLRDLETEFGYVNT